jgi:hypothetical protein
MAPVSPLLQHYIKVGYVSSVSPAAEGYTWDNNETERIYPRPYLYHWILLQPIIPKGI